jgi:hypothetical protein
LVSENNPGTLLLLRLQDGKFFLESADNSKLGQAAQDLIALVNAHGDGKLSFE